MKRLQENRIEQLSKYLLACKVDPELFPEILDHLSCEAEEQLWDGNSFEQAFKGIVETADSQTLRNLSVDHKHMLASEKSLNDIVFEGRNKNYGAYALRKGYGQTMQRAVLLGVSLFLLMVMLPNLYARLVPEPKAKDIAYEVRFEDVEIRPDVKLPSLPVYKTEKQEKKDFKNTLLEILPDDRPDAEWMTPGIIAPEPAANTLKRRSEAEGPEHVNTRVSGSGFKRASAIDALPEKEETFLLIDQNPEFIGGSAGMSTFLQENLHYPSQALKANIEGRVFVEFMVSPNGKIENVRLIEGIGFGCDEEAMRVLKLMPDWMPGKQGGRPVRVRFTLPVIFQID